MNINLFSRVLVPTDMTAFGDPALKYALQFSERAGSSLTLLYAEEISWLAAEHPLGYYFENVPEARVGLTRKLQDYAASHLPAGASFTTLFEDDAAELAIPRIAEEIGADLIVMGTHGRHGIRRAFLGSIAERVLRNTQRPVITVNPSCCATTEATRIRTILCPVNFTNIARTALEQAAAVAEAFDAQLVVLHVCEGSETRLFARVEEEFRTWIDPELRAHARYKEVVVHGDPAEQVLHIADHVDADLLVIGAEHRLFANSTIFGSTTERVTRFAKHAVMTVVAGGVRSRDVRAA